MSQFQEYDRREASFVRYLLERKNPEAENLQVELERVQSEIDSANTEMQRGRAFFESKEARRKIKGELRTRLIQLQGQKDSIEESLFAITDVGVARDVYRRILAIPRIKSAEVLERTLFIHTEVLYGKDKSGEWHLVGMERIEINLSEKSPSSIQWTNLTQQIKGSHGPPNIDANGKVTCFGDALPSLQGALNTEDWETVAAIVVRYPECAGSRDQITAWPKVDPSQVPSWYIETFGTEPEPPITHSYDYGG